MSLTNQKIILEAKIADLQRQQVSTDYEADMFLATLLTLADPATDKCGDFDPDKIEHAADGFIRNIRKFKTLQTEIDRLTKLL
ncbi:MAG: hypothetical protein RR555_05505 [Bacteroidales bacterium]